MPEQRAHREREITAAFARRRVLLSEQQAGQFACYLELLERWNRVISLTGIRDPRTAIQRHFVEPAEALPLLAGAGPYLLDVGSGAGSPGLPLKVLEPDRECTLVEANQKKATFLHEVVDALELEGVTILEGRLEALIDEGTLRGPVNVLTARGWTSGWGPMLGRMAPLMAPGGRGLIFTGEETLRALRRELMSGAGRNVPREWRDAVAAGWVIRRFVPLPELERGHLVALELPTE